MVNPQSSSLQSDMRYGFRADSIGKTENRFGNGRVARDVNFLRASLIPHNEAIFQCLVLRMRLGTPLDESVEGFHGYDNRLLH